MQLGSYLAYIVIALLFISHDKAFAFEGFFRKLQKRAAEAAVQRKDERQFIEGDILNDPEENVRRFSAPGDPDTWVKRRIPFVIDSGIDSSMTNTVHTAMRQIMLNTSRCIGFDDKRSFDNDYINITAQDDGCYGSIGRRGGPQILNLGKRCNSVGVVMHELMHALGFWNEQSRSDRDSFVNVLLENVIFGEEGNFNKRDKGPIEDTIPYDYDSILHYSYDQFSRNGGDTLRPTDTSVDKGRLGQRYQLSQKDIDRIRWLYDCGVRTCPTITWFQNGVVSVNSYAVGGQAKHSCISNQYKLIGAEIRACKADGVWSGSVPYCVAYRWYPYLYYNMYSEFGLTQTSAVRWRRNRGPTPSEDTGPHVDHTSEDSTGWYFYLEATDIPVKSTATFQTSEVRYTYSGGACLTFWYYMYGEGIGTLSVYVISSSYGSRRRLVWSSDRNGVLQKKQWQMATDSGNMIRLPVWYTYQVIFEATRGQYDTSDIAVDDVLVGHCSLVNSYQQSVSDDKQRNRQQNVGYSSPYRGNGLKKY